MATTGDFSMATDSPRGRSGPQRRGNPTTISEFCMTSCYAKHIAQLVTRVDDRLLAAVDALVDEGVAATRSDAVRIGLEGLVERHRRQQTGQAIVDAYLQHPQREDELTGLNEATRALVEEEPW
jgi:Arc/MetJ-type ribon-helix-helix transcriptional regulator